MNVFSLLTGLINGGDINSCSSIFTEGSQVFNFVLHHLDPASLFINVTGNLLTHLFDIFGDVTGIITALFSMNFFNIGKNSGDLIMLIVN